MSLSTLCIPVPSPGAYSVLCTLGLPELSLNRRDLLLAAEPSLPVTAVRPLLRFLVCLCPPVKIDTFYTLKV